MTYEELVAEAAAAAVEGWDFSWFEGRATEERPPWAYARHMAERMAGADAALDIETGGGEVLGEIERAPRLLVATESWPPNVAVARDRLRPLGAHVVAVTDSPALPFVNDAFDLMVSRHPVVVLWDEIARVLRPGGTYFSQQIGPGTNRELTNFFMEPRPVNERRSAASARGRRPRRPVSRWWTCVNAPCASSSSTWAPWSTSCARCSGRCQASPRRPTRSDSGPCTSA